MSFSKDDIVVGLFGAGIIGGLFWTISKAIDAGRASAEERRLENERVMAYRKETVDSRDILGDIDRASLENENLNEDNRMKAKALLMEKKAVLDRARSVQGISDAIGVLYDGIREFSGGTEFMQNSQVRWAWEKREEERERNRIAEEKAEAQRREDERMARLEKTVLSGISMLTGKD